jgi:hypothetical protein
MVHTNAVSHTPTPWTELPGYNQFKESDRAFIVRAVNCHEELLAVCKALIGPTKNVPFMRVVEMAKQAIAKAEGK